MKTDLSHGILKWSNVHHIWLANVHQHNHTSYLRLHIICRHTRSHVHYVQHCNDNAHAVTIHTLRCCASHDNFKFKSIRYDSNLPWFSPVFQKHISFLWNFSLLTQRKYYWNRHRVEAFACLSNSSMVQRNLTHQFARCITSTRIDRRAPTWRHVPRSTLWICGHLC